MVNTIEETKPNPLVKIFADFIYYQDFDPARVPEYLQAEVTALLATYPSDPYFDDHRHHIADVDGLQDALDGKVLKVEGMGLSTNDYTTAEKEKLGGVATNANNYSHPASHPASMITGLATVATSGSYADLSNKPAIPKVTSGTAAPSGGTDGDVYFRYE